MNTLVLYAWFPIVLYLFTRFPPQRAVIISFVACLVVFAVSRVQAAEYSRGIQ